MPVQCRGGARTIACLLAAAWLLIAPAAGLRAHAADVDILTVRDFKPVLLDLSGPFHAATGDTMEITGDTTDDITARVIRGQEPFDVVILPAAAMDALAAQAKVRADSVAWAAKSGVGVVVPNGAPLPDISTVEAFKRTMLAVPSFAYIDPGSGDATSAWIAQLFDRLGIAETMRAKAVLVPFGLAAARVDDGEAALALQQISELRVVPGVTFVGPLPNEIQHYVIYALGIPNSSPLPAATRALLALLRGEAGVHALHAHGFEPP